MHMYAPDDRVNLCRPSDDLMSGWQGFLQKLPHAFAFDLLLSLMVLELIFLTQILLDVIFKMCMADGDFDMAGNQKLAHIGNHSDGSVKQYAAIYSNSTYFRHLCVRLET